MEQACNRLYKMGDISLLSIHNQHRLKPITATYCVISYLLFAAHDPNINQMKKTSLYDECKKLEFELPGLESRGYTNYSTSTALVHSGQFSIRGLECFSYGFCDLILHDLVSDIAQYAIIIPQLELDAFTVQHDDNISITDSIATLPRSDAHGPVTDFAIVLVHAILAESNSSIPCGVRPRFDNWEDVKIDSLVMGLLGEVKRRPTRSAPTAVGFEKDLEVLLLLAYSSLVMQAKAAFKGHQETDDIILVAFAGEWYSWRLANRNDYDINTHPEARRQIIIPDLNKDSISEASYSNTTHAGTSNISAAPVVEEVLGPHRKNTRNKNYTDPESPVEDANDKYPYDRNPNPAPRQPKGTPKPPVVREVKKADFKRYMPEELETVQKPFTTDQWQQLENARHSDDLFRAEIRALNQHFEYWSLPVLVGTPESLENWFLIRTLLKDTIVSEFSGRSGPYDHGLDVSTDDEDDQYEHTYNGPQEGSHQIGDLEEEEEDGADDSDEDDVEVEEEDE
ncbi:hypothetical protein DXG01_001694 [Tephrocybe rancida]|nr:hypothetical protein DXG01_001694 [Tephrocybe rancida]